MPSTITSSSTTTLTDLLSHLIRMPTVSADTATNAAALDWVQEQLHDLPLDFRPLEKNGYHSLIATTAGVKNPKNPRLWLSAHMDVIPGAPDLFEPKVKDGRLLGRGSYDMKSAIAVYIKLLKELGDELLKYDLGLMLTSDEETSGTQGVGWLVEEMGYRGQAALLPDSLKTWEIENGAKGAVFWKLMSTGYAAHGSRIWDGKNAIDRLIDFVNELRKFTTSEPCGDPKHIHHTLNLGLIKGGEIVNMVPSTAEAEVDFRILPGTKVEEVADWIAAAQAAVPGVAAEQLPMQAPPITGITNGPVTLFANIAKAATGRDLPHVLAHGGTDARWFVENNIPTITIQSTGGEPHTPREWIDIADLDVYYNVVRQFVDEWAGPKRKKR